MSTPKFVAALKENKNNIRAKLAIAGGITLVAIAAGVVLTKIANSVVEVELMELPEGVTFEDVVAAFDNTPAALAE